MHGIEGHEQDEARRRALLAALPDLMLRLRRDGTYLEFAGDTSALANPASIVVGRRVGDLLPQEAADALVGAVEAALRTGGPAQVTYALRRFVDGALRDYEARIVPVAGAGDEVVAVVRDVTDARRLAREQDALRRVATLVASGAPEIELVQAIAAELGRLFDADAANALHREGDALHVVGEWRRQGYAPPPGTVYPFGGDTITARVFDSGGPARLDSADDLETPFARERWRALGIGPSIAAPVRVQGAVWGVVTTSRLDGRDPFAPGAEAGLADFATLLAQALENAESRRQMSHLLDEQSTLRQVATFVAGGRPPAEVLARVTRDVGRLFHAAHVEVVRWDGVPDEVTVVQSWAADPGRALEVDTPLRSHPGHPVIDVLEGGPATEAVLGEEAVAAAPLIINGVLRGAIAVSRLADAPFADEDGGRLRAFADLAAQSIGNDLAQRAVRESRARIVREGDEARRRLERNLHDGAQQRLVAVSISLRLAASLFGSDTDRARELVDSATTELTNAMQELRDLARGLHPAILSDQGLDAALRALVLRAPTETILENAIGERLAPDVEAAIYYVAAEALTNAAKYALSETVHVSVRCEGDTVALDVVDRGVGGATMKAGSGLQGLLDRVEAIGGRLDVRSPIGLGTTVSAVIPLGS